ncbi:MAG: DMT family transporter [Firmicutes bacterium]|nr:DMT family transporter [Bacillota bacterium]
MKNKNRMKGNILLMMTAMIWGTAFVAQKAGMDLLGPIAFNGIRTLVGALSLVPVILITGRSQQRKRQKDQQKTKTQPQDQQKDQQQQDPANRTLIIGGICCGLALCAAGNVQQIGLYYTSVSHTGFITALYVVIVPLMGLLLGKRVSPVMWCCVAASAVGLYLLCIPASGFGQVNVGDIIIFVCAICFAVHILIIDHFSPKVDGVKLSCIQFFVAGGVSLILMPFVDPALGFALPTAGNVFASWFTILYAGIVSCGIAFTFQVLGQKDTEPTIASMILCLESVFALLAGMMFLGEMMSLRETVGCVVMFAAIIVANLPVSAAKERAPGPAQG